MSARCAYCDASVPSPWADLPLDETLVSGLSAGWCAGCRRNVPIRVGPVRLVEQRSETHPPVTVELINGLPALHFEGRSDKPN